MAPCESVSYGKPHVGKHVLASSLLLTAFVASAVPIQEKELAAKLPSIFAQAAEHYRALDAAATPQVRNAKGVMCTPHGYKRDKRTLDMRPVTWWTSGHYPGALWYLYEATNDAFFRDRALYWTGLLKDISKCDTTHDVGFMMYCSYGNARRILKTDRYDALLAETAKTLCLRYNERLGLIRSWGKRDDKKDFRVIPDNLMNLELLEAVARFKNGDKRFDKIARSHADVTMAHHFRPDGGCFHVVDYDQQTKRVQGVYRGQGASCETAWSRGESWAVYGYVMMYRMTGVQRYLDFAIKLAEYCITHPNMPEDGIPYWDYGAPGEERDSSAGSILASALLELSRYVDTAARHRYRAFAVKQLLALASPAYFSHGDEIGHFLLKHGVGHKPGKSEIDTPLDYGDYYFLEALLRFRDIQSRESANAAVRDKLPPMLTLPADELQLRTSVQKLSAGDLRRAADRVVAEHIPDTLDALYDEFWTTGNRTHYQKPYFQRQKNLDTLVLAEAAEGKGRYLPRIADYIRAICSMRSWVMPAHDREEDGRCNLRGIFFSVDLGASEIAAHLACVVQLLGSRLDPAVVRLIRQETERHIFAPLRREIPLHANQGGTKYDMGARHHWWISTVNNWNAVCWDNVVCAALGLLSDPDDRALFVAAACRSVPTYLKGFTPDGYCSEGMGYWNYGFGHHLMMGTLLRKVTNGQIDIFTQPIQRKVAEYPRAYTLTQGVSPAFADGCGAVAPRLLALADAVWPDLPKTLPPVSAFPDAMVWLVRDPNGLNVAFKGGHNDELHNHNDVGSYYITQGKAFMAGDPGGEVYTRFTFSKERYNSKILNSYGHPVPRIGGTLQQTGKAFAAQVVSVDLNVSNTVVALELKNAYKVPSLKSCLRTFTYDRAKKTFAVRDHVVFTEPTALEVPYNTYLKEANASQHTPFVWNARPTVHVTGGAYKLVEEDVPNPDRIVPHRVAVQFTQPVSEAVVEMVYAPQATP